MVRPLRVGHTLSFMKKIRYVWLSFLLLGISSVVTIHHEENLYNASSHNENGERSIVPTPNSPQVDSDPQNAYSDHPSWNLAYDVFGFPGGITVWALFLTLIAIAEQSTATTKQAEIARQALVSQFRPMVQIRTVRLTESESSLFMEIVAVNKGGGTAHLLEGAASLDWIYTHSSKSHIATAHFAQSVIQPGEQQQLKIVLDDSWVVYRFSVDPDYSARMRLRCEGTLVYKDENGMERRTGFSRLRNAVTEKWEVDTDPEFEYATNAPVE